MSLILGINLPTRLFLAADTRLTTKLPSGIFKVEDNFWKAFSFSGDKISCVVAGNAKLASFVLNELEKSDISKTNIYTFRESINNYLSSIIDEYWKQGGEHVDVAFIFGGYDDTRKKMINATVFGDVQSKGLINVQGIKNQNVNNKVLEGLLRATLGKGRFQSDKNEEFEIDAQNSLIFSVQIKLPDVPTIKDVPCYDFVLFSQKNLTEKQATFDLVQKLEVEPIHSSSEENEYVYQSALHISSLIDEMIQKFSLEAVGGDMLTLLLTPFGAVLPTGSIIKKNLETGKVTPISEIIVSDGRFCRRSSSKQIVLFNNIIDFGGHGDSEL